MKKKYQGKYRIDKAGLLWLLVPAFLLSKDAGAEPDQPLEMKISHDLWYTGDDENEVDHDYFAREDGFEYQADFTQASGNTAFPFFQPVSSEPAKSSTYFSIDLRLSQWIADEAEWCRSAIVIAFIASDGKEYFIEKDFINTEAVRNHFPFTEGHVREWTGRRILLNKWMKLSLSIGEAMSMFQFPTPVSLTSMYIVNEMGANNPIHSTPDARVRYEVKNWEFKK